MSKIEKEIINILKNKVGKNYLSIPDACVLALNCDGKRLFITMKGFSYNLFETLDKDKQKEIFDKVNNLFS